MPYLLDALYLLALLVGSPWLVYKSLTTGKYRRGLLHKLFGRAMVYAGDAPCVWFHGVSVGEIHLLRAVIARFRQHYPGWECVVSTTTDTGYEEARKCFPDLPVFFWPFDFSWAVRRALGRANPALVVLAEGELWPNFLLAAKHRGIPVAVVNARLSPRSVRRHQHLRGLARPVFAAVDCWAVQTEEYAAALCDLGAVSERVHVTGSVKYDGLTGDRHGPRTEELRRLLAVSTDDLVWIAGSTQAPEEEIVLAIFRRARVAHPTLRLFLVPRQRERFEEVAGLLRCSGERFVRRRDLQGPLADRRAIVLVDTIGELGPLWGLADVAFVGGSLDGKRGGQNMIEPAAYGAAVVFGPYVWNFRDTVARLVEAGAALQVEDAAALEEVVLRLLGDATERQRRGTAAQQLVRSQQGATGRTLVCLERLMHGALGSEQAA
jgi:3-deoxy-D-manno-octulosonic-acid transferase